MILAFTPDKNFYFEEIAVSLLCSAILTTEMRNSLNLIMIIKIFELNFTGGSCTEVPGATVQESQELSWMCVPPHRIHATASTLALEDDS